MTINEISDKYQSILEMEPGETIEEQLFELMKSHLRFYIKDCSEQIADYEAKYGMDFEEFKSALQAGKFGDPYNYENEQARMEWESLCDEKEQLKTRFRQLVEEDRLQRIT
jgi:hypothetical protein